MSGDARPILAVDFDGVIHAYSKGWQDGTIYDPAVPGFFDWARKAKETFRLVIYSSRSSTVEGRVAMHNWLAVQLFQWKPGPRSVTGLGIMDFEFAHEKPKAFLTIDDRGMQFRGDWSAWWLQPDQLMKFRPWNVDGGEGCRIHPNVVVEDDLVTIYGVRYSMDLFKAMGAAALGSRFEVVARKDGMVTLKSLPARTMAQPEGLTPLKELPIVVDYDVPPYELRMHPETYDRMQRALLEKENGKPFSGQP